MTSYSSSTSQTINMSTETHVLKLLTDFHPQITASADCEVLHWKRIWGMFIQQIPQMYKNKENYFYVHRQSNQGMCGTEELIQQEFISLQNQGLEIQDDSVINSKNIYVVVPYKKSKTQGLRANLKFYRFLGKEDENGNCKGQGLSALLWGCGVMGDGLTYMKADIQLVPLDKDNRKVAVTLANFH